jgi:hypothetical protein
MKRKTEENSAIVAEPLSKDDAFRVDLAEFAKAGEEARRAMRQVEEAFAPTIRGLKEAVASSWTETWAQIEQEFRPLADGAWAQNMVLNAAHRGLSNMKAGGEECADLRKCRDDFLADFAVIAADAKIEKATRSAVSWAIANALFIGLATGDPELFARLRRDFGQAQAAAMRRARAPGLASNREATLNAVRAAMKATPARPTQGEAYARLIQPEVEKRLGRPLSVSTIRRYARIILEERS